MSAENKAEYLLPNLQAVNINDNCRVQLTKAGLAQYREEYAQYGIESPELDITEDGARFQLWQLMHTFGPLLYNGSTRLPFNGNTLSIERDRVQTHPEGEKRTVNINDSVYVFITPEGKRMYNEAYRQQAPRLKTVGALTEIQLHEVANIFGPSLYNGSTSLPIDTTLYLRPASTPKAK